MTIIIAKSVFIDEFPSFIPLQVELFTMLRDFISYSIYVKINPY